MNKLTISMMLYLSLVDISLGFDIDHLLRNRIKFYNLQPLKILPLNPNREQVALGEKLFFEKSISGNRRVSCQTCHNPETGTVDGLPLSKTEDSEGILRRNSMSLFNIGQANKKFMFWDGRVSFDSKTHVFTTPEPSLNGDSPLARNITAVMTSALSAQAIFPMVTQTEMMGKKGENEIADAKDRLEAWDRIIRRLKKDNLKSYSDLFVKAYPGTSIDEINIGHVGEAIAAFQREEFQTTGSPFQRYLKGYDKAMTTDQKRGLAVFLGRGKCISCHFSGELGGGNLFASVGTPQWGKAPLELDMGRAEVVGDIKKNYLFKIPSLLNVKLTAPYMHNGAFETLDEVLEHYNHPSESINKFKISAARQQKIPVQVAVAKGQPILDDIWLSSQSGLFPELDNRLFLTAREKKLLKIFLNEALTDPKWSK